jgi:hypothetical protein
MHPYGIQIQWCLCCGEHVAPVFQRHIVCEGKHVYYWPRGFEFEFAILLFRIIAMVGFPIDLDMVLGIQCVEIVVCRWDIHGEQPNCVKIFDYIVFVEIIGKCLNMGNRMAYLCK